MKRRDFLNKLGLSALAGGVALAGCTQTATECSGTSIAKGKTIKWKMVTSWTKNFPGLGTGAEYLAASINSLSAGRMQVKVYGAGQLVPAFEVFDFVSSGGAQMGHSGAYHWKGKNDAFPFFSAVPFGLTADEMNAWLYKGGGLELWREAYAPFDLIPAPAGNTGTQMAGWFNREINTLDDLQGLKMRILGLGGEVFQRAGGTPVTLPGSELFTALKTGVIDATEWVGPYNDLAMGFYKIAKYYYYPGWHEAGTTLECMINKTAFEQLPQDLQAIVLAACKMANLQMHMEYLSRNNAALQALINVHKVQLRQLPDDVLAKLKTFSDETINQLLAKNTLANRIYTSFKTFRDGVANVVDIGERAYLNSRFINSATK